jgi:hypothetical protein
VLTHLARLTRPVPAAGPGALALAVYADARHRAVAARESGEEGVACVDDAARLLDVLCDVWTATELPWVRRWAEGLLEFVLWMQEPDGRWLNFVEDWEGARNHAGITSETGENFWHARALVGVSHAWLTFADPRAADAMHRGLDHAVTKPAPPDVRALHVLTARRLIDEAGMEGLRPAILRWAGELAGCRRGDVLLNAALETGTPHLWGHIQEGVLASSSVLLEDPGLLDVAVRSADALIVPVIEGGFDRTSTSPYDVASCVYVADRIAEASGETRWVSLAADARAWFDGRNTAGASVIDPVAGTVADGIDEGRVSRNSGAEANIVAAEALLDRAVEEARSMAEPTLTG